MWRAAVVLAGVFLWQPFAIASGSHIRTDNARPQSLIEKAAVGSPTFRRLADRLEASSVVVYVQFGQCPLHVDACLNFVSATPPYLYVRATLDRFEGPPEVLAGLIAHELQHACELAEAGITTRQGFRQFYTGHGRHWSGGYETDRAAETGRTVERELSHR